MKKFLFCLFLCIAATCIVPQLLTAKTGYVSDMLLLTFREGPGTSYSVIKTLNSNTPVTILEEQNGFYKVRLQTKEIGWVDKKFIIFELPNALIVNQLEKEKKNLENKISNLESEQQALKNQLSSSEDENIKKIQSLDTALKATENKNKTLTRSLSETKNKYNTLIKNSKNIQDIVMENKTLKEKNITLAADLEALKKMNKSMFKTGMIKWAIAGVITLLIGWTLGRNISSKRQSGLMLD